MGQSKRGDCMADMGIFRTTLRLAGPLAFQRISQRRLTSGAVIVGACEPATVRHRPSAAYALARMSAYFTTDLGIHPATDRPIASSSSTTQRGDHGRFQRPITCPQI